MKNVSSFFFSSQFCCFHTDMQGSSSERFFVGGLLRTVTEEDVIAHFRSYGEGVRLTISRDSNGRSLGYGWMTFDAVDCHRLLNEPHKINGASIAVSRPERKYDGGSPGDLPHPSVQQSPPKSHAFLRNQSETAKRAREDLPRHSPTQSSRFPQPRDESTGFEFPEAVVSVKEQSVKGESGSDPCRVVSRWECDKQAASPSAPACSPTFVCIPLGICPAAFLHDPRVFCCTLDPLQVGKLNIVATSTRHDHTLNALTVLNDHLDVDAPQASSSIDCSAATVGDSTNSLLSASSSKPHLKGCSSSPPTQSASFSPLLQPASSEDKMRLVSSSQQKQVFSPPPPPGPPLHHNATVTPPPPGPPLSRVRANPPPPGPPPQKANVPPPPGPPPNYTKANEKASGSAPSRSPPPLGPPPPGPPPPRFITPPQNVINPPPPGPPPKR